MTSRRTPRLRVAVAGVGSFAQRVLIPGLCVSELAEVVAVFGPTPMKTQEVADRNSVPGVFNDYEAMLDDAKPDAVVIATPNDVHLPMSLAASGRGIHIVCEKPLGIDLAQATQMHDHARWRRCSHCSQFHVPVNNFIPASPASRPVRGDRSTSPLHRHVSSGHPGQSTHSAGVSNVA